MQKLKFAYAVLEKLYCPIMPHTVYSLQVFPKHLIERFDVFPIKVSHGNAQLSMPLIANTSPISLKNCQTFLLNCPT